MKANQVNHRLGENMKEKEKLEKIKLVIKETSNSLEAPIGRSREVLWSPDMGDRFVEIDHRNGQKKVVAFDKIAEILDS